MRYLLISTLCFFSYYLNAQTSKIDSLKTVLQQAQADTVKVRTLQSICNYYIPRDRVLARKYLDSIYELIDSDARNLAGYTAWYSKAYLYFNERKPDSVIYVLNQAMPYAKALKEPIKIAELHGKLAFTYSMFLKDTAKIMYHNDKVIELHNKHNLPFQVSQAYYTNGTLYRDKNEYPKALSNLIKVDSLVSTDKYVSNLKGNSALAAGNIFANLKQYDKAELYYNKAISYYQILDNVSDAKTVLVDKGSLFLKKGEVQKAINQFSQAEEYFNKTDNNYEKSELYMHMSDAYLKLEDTKKSNTYLLKAKEIKHKMKDSLRLSKLNIRLGDYYQAIGKLDSAKLSYSEAIEYSKLLNGTSDMATALKALSGVNAKLGNNKKALEQYKSYVALQDEITKTRNEKALAEIETKYQTAIKDKEIQELTYETHLKDANLAKAKSAQIALIVGAVAIILLLLVFFISKQKKEKAERLAQALQVEALQKRFMELHTSPAELSVDLDMDEVNNKLQTSLTEREFETLKLCIAGKTNSEIAKDLFVSVSTVKFHLRNAYSKLDVNNRKEAFQFILKSI